MNVLTAKSPPALRNRKSEIGNWTSRKLVQFPVSSFQFLLLGAFAPLRLCGKTVWQFLREVSGENDYARYRARALALGQQPLTPQDFYLEKLHRRYSRPSRCC